MKDKGSPGSHEKAIREILRYISEHPDAKDTVDGIIKWWRPKRQVEWRKKAVQEALDFLVSKGWLTRRAIAPSRKLYGVNKDCLEKIKISLRESGE